MPFVVKIELSPEVLARLEELNTPQAQSKLKALCNKFILPRISAMGMKLYADIEQELLRFFKIEL